MLELSAFQNAFCSALKGKSAKLAAWGLSNGEAPGLSVYRNSVAKASADALAATYRTVEQLVGEDWFRAAAVVYATDHPPVHPSLLDYGGSFPEWLASFPPAQDTPYLAQVAEIDKLWLEAYFAPDAEPLAPAAFSRLRPSELGRLSARLVPSARLAAFDQNIVSLWLAHHDLAASPDGFELTDAPERMLIARPFMEVEVWLLDAAGYAFFGSCAAGDSLLTAVDRMLATNPTADLAWIIATALEAGVFTALAPVEEE